MTARGRSVLLVRLVCLGGALFWMGLAALDPALLERFELAALDTELRLAPAPHASPEIIIIAVDERSVHRYGPLSWPPAQMGELITTLDRAGARVIAFDFVFTGEWHKLGQAEAEARARHAPLRAALERSGKVVLGTFFDFEAEQEDFPGASEPEWREHRARRVVYLGGAGPAAGQPPPVPAATALHPSRPEIAAAAHSNGHLNLLPSDDGIIRWMPLVARYQGDLYTSFSVEVARTFLGDVLPEIVIGQGRIEGLRLGKRRITTDEHGRLLVRFAGRRATYKTYSAADLLAGQIPAPLIRNRIVLVGSSAAGAADVWATPLDPLLPGVEIHANAIDNMLQGNFLVRNWLTRLLSLAQLALLGLAGAVVLPLIQGEGMRRVGLLAAAFLGIWLVGHFLLFTRTGYILGIVSPLLAAATVLGGTLVVQYFTEEKQRRQVELCFEHYLDRNVIDTLLERPDRLRLGGERRELTVLFCDIRNFTTLAEELPPEAIVEMLNEFFTTMTGVVFSTGGLVDKFVGDQIMAIWGAPLESADHAAKACAAALGMAKAFNELRTRWAELPSYPSDGSGAARPAKSLTMNCGLGINTGPMVVGNIGSARRFSYTVIGDHVNVASRLEALNKTYGTQVLVGPATYAAARDRFRFREIDQVRVKGRSQALTVYELLGRCEDPDLNLEWLATFAEGLEAYRRNDWAAAARAFAAAQTRNPYDACAKFYLSRVEQMAKNPNQEDWETAPKLG